MIEGELNDKGVFVYPGEELLPFIDVLTRHSFDLPVSPPHEIVVVDHHSLPHEVICRTSEKGTPPMVRTRRGVVVLNNAPLSGDERLFRPGDRLQIGELILRCVEVQPGVFAVDVEACPERVVNALITPGFFRWTVTASNVDRRCSDSSGVCAQKRELS